MPPRSRSMARTAQATEATESDKERTRRARKRITDRKSQQQHRQRQRAYVRELEETVQAYKQSCAQNGSVDVATLLSENEQLRKRCQNLESLLAKINNLSSGHGIIHFQATASSPDSTEQTASPETKSTQATSAHDHDHEPHSNASQEGQDHHFSGLPGITQGPATASASTSPNPLSNMSLPLFGEDTGESATSVASGLRYPNTVSDNLFARAPSVDVDDPAAPAGTREDENDAQLYPLQHELESQEGASIEAMDRFLASIVDGTAISLDIVPMSLTTRDPLLSRLCGPQASVTDEALTYMVYPTTTAPSCQWDNFMQRVINEAKAQHSLGQFPTSAPTLRAVLSRQSSDVLASRLYHWLSSYLPMPLHMFLAIFWVQYLFLRWYVLGTRASYLQMPEFMRPTDLERRIPHAMCIGMLVWPDVRRALIRDAGMADPELAGMELLKHATQSWTPRAHVNGDLIGSTDVLAIVERQACHLDTWMINPSFRDNYPEFANCRIVYAS